MMESHPEQEDQRQDRRRPIENRPEREPALEHRQHHTKDDDQELERPVRVEFGFLEKRRAASLSLTRRIDAFEQARVVRFGKRRVVVLKREVV